MPHRVENRTESARKLEAPTCAPGNMHCQQAECSKIEFPCDSGHEEGDGQASFSREGGDRFQFLSSCICSEQHENIVSLPPTKFAARLPLFEDAHVKMKWQETNFTAKCTQLSPQQLPTVCSPDNPEYFN